MKSLYVIDKETGLKGKVEDCDYHIGNMVVMVRLENGDLVQRKIKQLKWEEDK